jgi:hypothetical protein
MRHAQHALQLDARLAEAHAVMGNVAMSYDWDLQNRKRAKTGHQLESQ